MSDLSCICGWADITKHNISWCWNLPKSRLMASIEKSAMEFKKCIINDNWLTRRDVQLV